MDQILQNWLNVRLSLRVVLLLSLFLLIVLPGCATPSVPPMAKAPESLRKPVPPLPDLPLMTGSKELPSNTAPAGNKSTGG